MLQEACYETLRASIGNNKDKDAKSLLVLDVPAQVDLTPLHTARAQEWCEGIKLKTKRQGLGVNRLMYVNDLWLACDDDTDAVVHGATCSQCQYEVDVDGDECWWDDGRCRPVCDDCRANVSAPLVRRTFTQASFAAHSGMGSLFDWLPFASGSGSFTLGKGYLLVNVNAASRMHGKVMAHIVDDHGRSGFFTFDEPVQALAAHSRRLTARHEAHIVMLAVFCGSAYHFGGLNSPYICDLVRQNFDLHQ